MENIDRRYVALVKVAPLFFDIFFARFAVTMWRFEAALRTYDVRRNVCLPSTVPVFRVVVLLVCISVSVSSSPAVTFPRRKH